MVPRKSREEEIINAIRAHLVEAVKRLETITDERLMKAAKCARATYYKYVTEGSAIEFEIDVARTKQRLYAESVRRATSSARDNQDLKRRLQEAEEGGRALLALISRMTENLLKRGIKARDIQAAQREAMPHPNRSFSHAGKGRRRK